MILSEQANWLLSSMELALCLNILGRGERTVLPVAETEQPIRRRMLEGFLHLAEIGLLEPGEEGYLPTDLLRSRLLPIAEPEYILQLPDGGSPAAAYIRGEARILVEVTDGEGQTCRISSLSDEELRETLLELLRSSLPLHPSLELRDGKGELREWVRFSEDGTAGTEKLTPEFLDKLRGGLPGR